VALSYPLPPVPSLPKASEPAVVPSGSLPPVPFLPPASEPAVAPSGSLPPVPFLPGSSDAAFAESRPLPPVPFVPQVGEPAVESPSSPSSTALGRPPPASARRGRHPRSVPKQDAPAPSDVSDSAASKARPKRAKAGVVALVSSDAPARTDHEPHEGMEPTELPAADRAGPAGDVGVDRQLAGLFGESVFGAWMAPGQYLGPGRTGIKRRSWGRRLLVLALLAVTAVATTRLIRTGLARQAGQERDRFAEELAEFVKEGALERASEFVSILETGRNSLDPADPHLDLLIRAEAALYRYHDANPERLRRIEQYLAAPQPSKPSASRVVAGMAVLSREERASRLAALEGQKKALEHDPEFFYLLATTLEQRGDIDAAREAWKRSADLGPLWLVHRFEQALFETRHGNRAGAAKIASQMISVDADSPWSRLAVSWFGDGTLKVPPVSAEGGVRTEAPALLYRARLRDAVAASRRDDPGQARRHLANALQAVNNQAPFVFDAFDCLVKERAVGLARQLTTFEAWPEQSPIAKAKASQLSEAAVGKPEDQVESETTASNSEAAGTREGQTGATVSNSDLTPEALGKKDDGVSNSEAASKPGATVSDSDAARQPAVGRPEAAAGIAVNKLEDMREVTSKSVKAAKPRQSKATRKVARSKPKAKPVSKNPVAGAKRRASP
jgi:tetratricopeptide (TPR) repeat protein